MRGRCRYRWQTEFANGVAQDVTLTLLAEIAQSRHREPVNLLAQCPKIRIGELVEQ